MILLDKTK